MQRMPKPRPVPSSNSLRSLAADDFSQEKSPLKIGRVIATSFFPQPSHASDLEHTGFLRIILESTQPSGEAGGEALTRKEDS